MKNKYLNFLILTLAFFSFAFQSDCQKADLGPYVKFASDAEVPRITLEDAKKEYDKGTAVIIDSRANDVYKQEHIKGALNIPIGSPESRFSEIPKGKKIIVYCSWGAEHTSASLAFQLNQKEIPGTYALLGGTAAWKNAGYPMESAESKPAAMEPLEPTR